MSLSEDEKRTDEEAAANRAMRGAMPPAPISFAEVRAWLEVVESGHWTWLRNSQCKYVSFHFDTRRGCIAIRDRDGNEIGIADLMSGARERGEHRSKAQ